MQLLNGSFSSALTRPVLVGKSGVNFKQITLDGQGSLYPGNTRAKVRWNMNAIPDIEMVSAERRVASGSVLYK